MAHDNNPTPKSREHELEKGPVQPNPPMGRAVDDEEPDRSPMDKPADPAKHKHGNIETDTPGEQQSVDDINTAVEEIIEQSDKEGPSRGAKK